MCKDVSGEPKRLRFAVCSCGASFPDCDLIDALFHITPQSSTAHHWVWIKPQPFMAGRVTNPLAKQFLSIEERKAVKFT